MNVQPITEKSPACFGVMCERHHECARYHAVEQTGRGQYHAIGTCDEYGKQRPLFVPIMATA